MKPSALPAPSGGRSDRSLYFWLLGHARPYWRIGLLSVLAMLCSAALEPVMPALMQPLIDRSLIAQDPDSIWQVPVLIVLTFLGKGVSDYVATVSSQTLAQRTIEDLRARLFAHELLLPMARHQAEEGGRMMSRITFDTSMIGDAVSTAWLVLIRDSLVLVGLMAYLFYTSWQLTLLILGIAPVLAWLIRQTSRRLRASSQRVQEWVGRLTGSIEESLLGLQDIKLYRAYDQVGRRFREINSNLRREQLRVIRVQALNVPLVQVLAASSVALVIYVASRMSADDGLSPGEFVSFVTAMSMIFEPVRRLTNVNAVLQKGLAAAQSLRDLLEELAESDGEAQERPERLRGEIEFSGVEFSYPGAAEPVLRDFSLRVQPGERVALVGPSGSGKSTLLLMVAGLVEPSAGELRIDGLTIRELGLPRLRASLAMVSQRVMLFDRSVRENLCLGRVPLEDPAEEDRLIWQALEAASADGFVRALPMGLETQLGSLGDRLSGGQRQRLAIARAFLRDAPILLLDEATSALDRDSEQAVLQGLARLMAGRTVLMVSHSPERLFEMDQVVMFPGR